MNPKVCQNDGKYSSIVGKGTDKTTTSTSILACHLPFLIIPGINNLQETFKVGQCYVSHISSEQKGTSEINVLYPVYHDAQLQTSMLGHYSVIVIGP
jgi:hypothetical protein